MYEGNLTVGEKIKLRRTMKGMTLEELGKSVGLSRGTIWKYEQNKTERLNTDIVYRLCNVLGCSPQWLMGFEEWDNYVETLVEAISADEQFKLDIQNACEKYNDIGRGFTDADWEEIINYIKFKAMQKG